MTTLFEQHRSITSTETAALSEWELDTTAVGHFSRFITHRLQANKSTVDYSCGTHPGWLNATVARQEKLQANNGKQQSGQGWSTGDGQQLATLFTEAANMQLQRLNNSASYDPYWVIQTDKTILPNHGFVNQKLLWCFIDLTINLEKSFDPRKTQKARKYSKRYNKYPSPKGHRYLHNSSSRQGLPGSRSHGW